MNERSRQTSSHFPLYLMILSLNIMEVLSKGCENQSAVRIINLLDWLLEPTLAVLTALIHPHQAFTPLQVWEDLRYGFLPQTAKYYWDTPRYSFTHWLAGWQMCGSGKFMETDSKRSWWLLEKWWDVALLERRKGKISASLFCFAVIKII